MLVMIPLLEELGAVRKNGTEHEKLKEIAESMESLHWDDAFGPDFYTSAFFLPETIKTKIFTLANSILQTAQSSRTALAQGTVVSSVPAELGFKFDEISRDLKKALGID